MSTALSLAGLPLSRWLFALRIWLAIYIALGAAFWVQLDGASSAGVTAAILALQTRGQIFEKSAYRLLGTVVGGAVAIVIVGLFAQARDLYVFAYAAWLGVCVFAAGFLDGNRAYGAVICGYTVSIVAVFQVDDPGNVFSEVINRCAAVAIGIASITLVVDLLRGPEIGPALIARIGGGCGRVRAFTDAMLRDGPAADTDARVAAMMRVASDQHPLLNALPIEAVSGTSRAGAVRATLAALAGEVRAARALAIVEHRRQRSDDPDLRDLIVRRLRGELLARREGSASAFAAARDGRPVPRPPRMPIYRPRENALLNGLRAFVASVASAYLFIWLGWPEACVAWAFVGVLMCLSANAPDPNTMTKGSLVAIPVAIALGGITQFLVLDGVDAFPLLMLGTAPALFACLLLTSSPKPAHASIGLLGGVYTLVMISPSNPQQYDPQTYLFLSAFVLAAAVLAFVLVRVLFPATDAQRRHWVLGAARRDMRAALRGKGRKRPEAETRLLDASRIGTLVGLKGVGPADIGLALHTADLARAARRISRALDLRIARAPDPSGAQLGHVRDARAALAAADAPALRRAARALAGSRDEDTLRLAADLAWAAGLIEEPAWDEWVWGEVTPDARAPTPDEPPVAGTARA